MAGIPIITKDGELALTEAEVAMLQALLTAHDRGAFYMTYNAMTNKRGRFPLFRT